MSRTRKIILAAAAGFVLTWVAFRPGLLPPEAVLQQAEAHAGPLSDSHSPLMTLIWRACDHIGLGSSGMLGLQAALFWAGLGFFAFASSLGPGALALGLLPPLLALLGAIGEDAGVASALLLAVALLRGVDERRARGAGAARAAVAEPPPSAARPAASSSHWRRVLPLAGAGAALLYACALRRTAALAALPICLWAGAILTERISEATRTAPRSPRLHALANGLGIFFAIALAAAAADFALTSLPTYPAQRLLLHDLVGVSLDQGELLIPNEVRPPDLVSVVDLAPLYSTADATPLYCCSKDPANDPPRFAELTDAHAMDELEGAWLETVPAHAGSYLRHRWRVFQQLLGVRRHEVCGFDGAVSGMLGAAVLSYADFFRNSVLFRGWAYLLLAWGAAAALVARAFRRRSLPSRDEGAVWAVAWSGALYLGGMFFIATGCDFRAIGWTVLSVLLLPALLPARDRLRLRYRLRADLRAIVTREIKGAQAPGSRLCLFAHYDGHNRVSDAVVFYVRALQECGLEVQFISTNEALPESEVAKILPHCSKILLRKNVGIDFGSWRVGLSRVSLEGYEQLVLANDSVFGPLQPLGPIFEKMKEHDLWGMSDSSEGGSLHLQSYFLVFGPKAFESAPFRAFWEGFRFYLRKSSYIRHGEIGLSKAARAAGWNVGAFVSARAAAERALADPDFSQFRGHLASGRALNPTLFLWDVLIRDFGFPFLKAELPRLNRLKMANLVAWRKVVAAASSYDPELIERALGGRLIPRVWPRN